jgi:hypothetical protein
MDTPKPNRRAFLGIFSGLVPQLLAIVPFSLGRWGLGLAVSVGGSLLLIGSRLGRREAVSALDLTSIGFGLLLAVGYFGFHNVFLLRHFGVVINGILLGQVVLGELRREPWTAQFAKRMYPPERWGTRAFFVGNRLLSRVWGAIFLADILMAAFGRTGLVLFILPNLLPMAALFLGPRLGHWYAVRSSVTET